MGLLEQGIAALDRYLDAYGESVGVLKYAPSAGANAYRQRALVYAAAVPVLGFVAHHPTEEELQAIGSEEDEVGMITFSRAKLVAAIGGNEGEWVQKPDRVEVDGTSYNVIGTHLTGTIGGASTVVAVTFKKEN